MRQQQKSVAPFDPVAFLVATTNLFCNSSRLSRQTREDQASVRYRSPGKAHEEKYSRRGYHLRGESANPLHRRDAGVGCAEPERPTPKADAFCPSPEGNQWVCPHEGGFQATRVNLFKLPTLRHDPTPLRRKLRSRHSAGPATSG